MPAPLIIGAVVAGGFIGAWIIDSVSEYLNVSQSTAAQMDTNQAVQNLTNAGANEAAIALAQASETYAQSQAGGFDLEDTTQLLGSLLPLILITTVVGKLD